MGRYLVELHLSKHAADDPASTTERARAAAAEARSTSSALLLRSIVVPEDETWFLLYDAPTAAAVTRAVEQAELAGARIVEAIVTQ